MTNRPVAADRPTRISFRPTFALGVVIIGLVTAFRLWALTWSDTDLFFDEAQYWFWSTDLEAGYYSKPPLIAWIIRAATLVCGDGEACIRAPSAIAYGLTALLAAILGRRLGGESLAFWAGIMILTLPGATFGARIISTDAFLLVFWTAALVVYWRLCVEGGTRNAVLLGLAIGFGLLSKYAMVYFALCILVHWVVDRDIRKKVHWRALLIAASVAFVCMVPNIVWNAMSGWLTFSHTADNANWSSLGFRPLNMIEFILTQAGIIGPVLTGALVVRLFRRSGPADPVDRFLLSFSIPIIVAISIQALLSRAHGNWAAVANVTLAIYAVRWLIASQWDVWLQRAAAIHVAFILFMVVSDANAQRFSDAVTFRSPYTRVLGYQRLADAVLEQAQKADAQTVIANRRSILAGLTYYLRNQPLVMRTFVPHGTPRNHYQQVARWSESDPVPVLVVSDCPAIALTAVGFPTAAISEISAKTAATWTRNVRTVAIPDGSAAAIRRALTCRQ